MHLPQCRYKVYIINNMNIRVYNMMRIARTYARTNDRYAQKRSQKRSIHFSFTSGNSKNMLREAFEINNNLQIQFKHFILIYQVDVAAFFSLSNFSSLLDRLRLHSAIRIAACSHGRIQSCNGLEITNASHKMCYDKKRRKNPSENAIEKFIYLWLDASRSVFGCI